MDVVLVDKEDRLLDFKEKYETHHNPVPLHRAISVVIFSPDKKKMLLQKRPSSKPTWPLFWSNTTCTHPFKDESYQTAAERRLQEEMGFSVPLKEQFKFIYEAKFDKTWGEHELDAVFTGTYDGEIKPNPEEVEDYKWMHLEDLEKDIKQNPDIYTPWFKIILSKLQLQ